MRYDVTIIGGGLAGLSLACLLGQGGVKTACVERNAPGKDNSLRTTALSWGSQQILDRAGIWQKLENACPVEDIRIYDGDSPLLLSFLSREVEDKPFGWVALNRDLLAAMRARAQECGVDLIAPAIVKNFEIGESAVTILENGEKIESSLIIGADGRNSFVREWIGVATRAWDYGQRAVLCVVSHENPHHNAAIEHFRPEGPFAALPMADDGETHRSAVVLTEHGPKRKSLMNLSDEMFEAVLREKFPPEYGSVKAISPRACFPLTFSHAAEYIAPRMALVADAAHGLHPVAAQGLNLGLRDVNELAALVIEARAAGNDPGDAALLEAYQRRRRPPNTAMAAATDALVRVFSNRLPPLRAARRAGVKLLSKSPRARKGFIRRAMGDF